MKKIYSTLKLILPILLFSFSLINCGGGGGGSSDSSGGGGGPPPLAYVGLTTPATITESNSEDMVFGSLLGVETGYSFALSAESQDEQSQGKQPGTVLNHPNVIDLPLVLKSTSKNISFNIPKRYPLSAAVSAVRTSTEVINGNCGGTAKYTLNINDATGTYDGTFIFSQFCEDGIVISGDTKISGTVNLSTGEIITITYVFENLTVDDFIYKGDVFVNDAVTPQIITLDLLAKDSASDKVYWAKDYSLIITEINATDVEIEVTGTYYDPDQGYVTVSTPEPLLVSTEDWPIFGILLCVGDKNTKARLTAINEYSYRIEADTNGDDTFDYSSGDLIWPGATLPSPWQQKASMPTPRYSLAAGVVNEKIYAIGGVTLSENWSNVVEEYQPLTNQWITKSPMSIARDSFAVGVVNGKIYAIGGGLPVSPYIINSVEEYDPITDSWVAKAPMSTSRARFAIGVVDGKIYAIGGWDGTIQGAMMSTVEEYNPVTNSWSSKAPMPTPRRGLTVAVANGKIYAIGGYDQSGPSNVVEEYNPVTDSWSPKTTMPTKREYLCSGTVNGEIYAIGGNYFGELNTVEAYNPLTDSWTTKTAMPTTDSQFAAAVANNKIYIMGLSAPSTADYSKVYEYTPSFDPL